MNLEPDSYWDCELTYFDWVDSDIAKPVHREINKRFSSHMDRYRALNKYWSLFLEDRVMFNSKTNEIWIEE